MDASRLNAALDAHVEAGDVTGLSWLVAHSDNVVAGAAGTFAPGDNRPVEPDTIHRIASLTKVVTATAALVLVDDGRLRLDDPVDRWLPELADRRVMRDPHGSLDDTVPAARAIITRDLLTSTFGVGWDFSDGGPQPVMTAMDELGLGLGPPSPAGYPPPDEWITRCATLPLQYQPGERWLYHTAFEVLGVLVGRAAGQSFVSFLGERIFNPLGMHDTGFVVPADRRDRLGPCFVAGADGSLDVFDAADGQWATQPPFESGGGGLVSTVGDLHRFAAALADRGGGVVSPAHAAALATNALTGAQLAESAPDPSGDIGWGYGVGVRLRTGQDGESVGTYGWDGGLGSTWRTDPGRGIIAVLLTNRVWNSPQLPPVCATFYRHVFAG